MSHLVSIVIPCYNAERWVCEAIQSCLDQEYQPIEIIVVDDGSTDGSLERIKSFGKHVIYRTGPNRGGNHARNVGFSLSSGQYVQFLDADDLLLPHKISRQVACLEHSGADVVYGDWRHQYHWPDGQVKLGDIVTSGEKSDVLEALLSHWWVAPVALLFRRSIVTKIRGWDESLRAAQDADFFISAAMSDARIVYQPGCYSIYRRYGNDTVSTGNLERWLDSHCCVLDKVLAELSSTGRLKTKYRQGLAGAYFLLARNYFDIDRSKYHKAMEKTLILEPNFRPRESRRYRTVQRVFGFRAAEQFASLKRKVMCELRSA